MRLFWNEVTLAGALAVTPTELCEKSELLNRTVAFPPDAWTPLVVFSLAVEWSWRSCRRRWSRR
jgi:hypothetical protein